ncbi:Tannase and feruloyl esterase [compost metagenome]
MKSTFQSPRSDVRRPRRMAWQMEAAMALAAVLAGCGGSSNGPAFVAAPIATPTPPTQPSGPTVLACDDTIKTGFKPDDQTTVLLVKAFRKGDPLALTEAVTADTPTAGNDLCLVKLNVGPGNPGPAEAPSTSAGIGLEIWLPTPANWNQRVHALGSGGWGGGNEGSTTKLQNQLNAGGSAAAVAASEGAVSVTTDTGHADTAHGGSFAMNPDGTINTVQWRDFSTRSVHEMAVKSKALAKAYYGAAPLYAYFDGGSMGGRQALGSPQVNPADFDGILVAFPANNWTRFITADLYPQIVFQRDLGGVPLTTGQQNLASNAAINACDLVGGQHLGFILDDAQCRYDPTKDANVLCQGIAGNSGVAGKNTTPDCVNLAQATALNKIWYGMTSDGSVPDPAVDNGWDTGLSGNRRWYGTPRGTSLSTIASPTGPFTIAVDVVALNLQDPTLAGPTFLNASGNGASKWKSLSYAQLSNAFDRGTALQGAFDHVDADNPDLSAFKARGGKILHYHGMADGAIMPQGSIDYFERVVARMGGLASAQDFYRLYLVPAMGHGFICLNGTFFCNDFTTRYFNGTTNPDAHPPVPDRRQLYAALQAWVEKGVAPDVLAAQTLPSSPVAKSLPLCAYPKKITFASGDPLVAASYACR